MNIYLKEIQSELNPFDIYTIFKDEKHTVILDSGMDHNNLGRYSFIGVNPFIVVKGRKDQCFVNEEEHKGDIFQLLSKLLDKYKAENNTDIPFIGGCIGYFSYDLGLELENISSNSLEDLIIPHFYFVFYDNLIICDNSNNKKYISACGILNKADLSIAAVEELIMKSSSVIYEDITKSKATFSSNFSKEEYIATVSKVKEYIRSGDIYITNLTQRFTASTQKDSYSIYKDLRKINPAPFSAFMRLQDFDIISSSPERFLKITNKIVETRPIKGTSPRGATPKEDEANKRMLLNSDKDKAELLMIVDLERNDLSKVCKPHTVKVTELFALEEYSTVFHLVSTVVGELRNEIDSVQCLKACFPGGSITGTPKIRAMEIIDELERLKRTAYTGCMGYFSFDGNADFNIIIRTMIKKYDNIYFGVGGGITWDSDEAAEYQETLDKAKALMRVV